MSGRPLWQMSGFRGLTNPWPPGPLPEASRAYAWTSATWSRLSAGPSKSPKGSTSFSARLSSTKSTQPCRDGFLWFLVAGVRFPTAGFPFDRPGLEAELPYPLAQSAS